MYTNEYLRFLDEHWAGFCIMVLWVLVLVALKVDDE